MTREQVAMSSNLDMRTNYALLAAPIDANAKHTVKSHVAPLAPKGGCSVPA